MPLDYFCRFYLWKLRMLNGWSLWQLKVLSLFKRLGNAVLLNNDGHSLLSQLLRKRSQCTLEGKHPSQKLSETEMTLLCLLLEVSWNLVSLLDFIHYWFFLSCLMRISSHPCTRSALYPLHHPGGMFLMNMYWIHCRYQTISCAKLYILSKDPSIQLDF